MGNSIEQRQHSIARAATTSLFAALGAAVVIVAIAVTFQWYRHLPDLEDSRWRILLTLLGIAAGAWLLRPIVLAADNLPRSVFLVGSVALVVSQVCFYILVWTTWKTSTFLWRIWWVAVVIAVAVAHAAWVRQLIGPADAPRWVRILGRVVDVNICIGMVLVASLALGQTPLPETSTLYQVAIALPLAVALIGTIVLASRAWKLRGVRVSTPLKIGAAAVAMAGVFVTGFYLGRLTAPETNPFEAMPAALAHLSAAELETQLDTDLRRLKIGTAGLDELTVKSWAMHQEIESTRQAEKRDYYRPAEEDRVRAAFMSYLAYRAALLRLAATYSSFSSIPDPALRARAFLIGYTAGTTVMDASQRLVATYRDLPLGRKKLNEPDESCGIPPGSFDRIYRAVTDERNIEKIEEMAAFYQTRRESWAKLSAMSAADLEWLDGRISDSLKRIRAAEIGVTSARLEHLINRVKQDTYDPMYAAQSVVSTLIGDTRMVARPPFISIAQVRQIQPQLRPGDIFLERRNWFMSNAFLPGFWPHAALYIGTIEEIEKLGLVRRTASGGWTSDEPAIRNRIDEFLKLAEDGQPHTVIESVSEGVIFNSLTHSMHADYVAVLRPHRLSDADRARAIARAFSHVGKPYDFEFDFFSADKLVCTELVYRSYDGMIKFDLVPIMGRSTLPALEIARKFATEWTREDRDLDFVLFLDATPQNNSAGFVGENDFCQSIHRPRGFNE